MKKFLFLLISALALTNAYSQNVAINATGSLPDNSAMLDVSSTTKGFLPPRMTLLQRNIINQPATGIIIYQTDNVTGLYCNMGTAAVPDWQLIGPLAPLTYGYFSGPGTSGNNTLNVFHDYYLSTTNSANGISLSGGSAKVFETGLYRIDFQAVTMCTGGNSTVDVNIAVNGVNTPQSNSTNGGGVYGIQTLSDFRIISLTAGSKVSLRFRLYEIFDHIISGGLIITQLR